MSGYNAEYTHAYYLKHRGVGRVRLLAGERPMDSAEVRAKVAARLTRHGHTRNDGYMSPEYNSWRAAKERTTYPGHRSWSDYGGRGIRMADEWLNDFAAFLVHIGPRSEGTSLDRIDPDGDYAPGNVRWADRATQGANRRTKKGR